MWTRRELKEKAKDSFRFNYWKCVLVSLLLAFLLGSSGSAGRSANKESFSSLGSATSSYLGNQGTIATIEDNLASDSTFEQFLEDHITRENAILISAFIIVFVLIVLVVTISLSVFLGNPLIVGCKHFYANNLHTKAELKEIGYAFDHNYVQIIKIMFFKGLYTFLWSLLFIIPGIIKGYEYRMIPYILGDDPDIIMEEAFARSKQMMMGNKWNAFVLDLSFIGWHILNACTCGILGVFYVNPYVHQTDAALYIRLKNGTLDDAKEDIINI